MSMIDVFKNYVPVENPEYGAKKKLIGDAVAQVISLEKITSKAGAEWVIFKCEAINCIDDPKGRETTISPGDELTKVYNPNDSESMQDLANDLFTAGIEFTNDVDSDYALLNNIGAAAKGKYVYFRTWAKDKTEAQKEKSKPGSSDFYQNVIIKSKNLVTPENSIPQLPF